jgi:hypothetical protein
VSDVSEGIIEISCDVRRHDAGGWVAELKWLDRSEQFRAKDPPEAAMAALEWAKVHLDMELQVEFNGVTYEIAK